MQMALNILDNRVYLVANWFVDSNYPIECIVYSCMYLCTVN